MIQQLKEFYNFNNKLIFLSDVCHKSELLFESSLTMWVDHIINTCKNIVPSKTTELAKGSFENSQVVIKKFVTMPTVQKTRFAEYTHKQSIL